MAYFDSLLSEVLHLSLSIDLTLLAILLENLCFESQDSVSC